MGIALRVVATLFCMIVCESLTSWGLAQTASNHAADRHLEAMRATLVEVAETMELAQECGLLRAVRPDWNAYTLIVVLEQREAEITDAHDRAFVSAAFLDGRANARVSLTDQGIAACDSMNTTRFGRATSRLPRPITQWPEYQAARPSR